MLQYSAEVFLKSISFRPFSAECDSKDKESLEEEREDLLSNLVTMGVDIDMARRRQPGVFNKAVTNEQELKLFLLSKGASDKVIGSIISRYPRAITRTPESLSKRWDLWRKIMASDLEIVNILERSPESFFRSNNNLNLENNIKFLCSVGLTHKCLCRLLTNAPRTFSNSLNLNKQMVEFLQETGMSLGHNDPRTFSNSLNLNKQMVEFLQETGMSLGHNDPRDFVRKIISKNPSILIQSTKRVKTNIEFLQSTFNLNKQDLLLLICGPGARILDLSNDCTKKNYTNIRERLLSLGCSEEEVQRFVLSYLNMVFLSEKKFNDKIDCLIEEKISASQIIENPRILDSSINTLKTRIRELSHAGYDLSTSSIALLSWSQRRYEAKLKRLCG